MRRDILSSKPFQSRIHGEDTQKSEQVLGYFLGPCLTYMVYSGIAGTYLTQFYTDVLGLTGSILTLMPLVSKIISSIAGLVIGRMIDRTHTAQGKARPWILFSGVLLCVSGILLYTVPRASYQVQIIWVVVSYNLFFGLAFSVYSLSHSLMVPLSTRNTRQRDTLAMLTSTGTSMIPGMLVTVIMPVLVSKIGVGIEDQPRWITVMGLLAVIAIPATLIEYYFTLERVTAESSGTPKESVSFGRQVAACFKDKYWVMILAFTMITNLCNSMNTSSMLYYCNWVLGDSVESGAAKQILVNVIGQAPMGFGVVLLWPLVRRFGKRKVTIVGFSAAAVGSAAVWLYGDNMTGVLASLFIKSIGAVPSYVSAALVAEALDHVEWENHFRADGFSASVQSIIQMVMLGLAQTILLGGIHLFGYIAPESTAQIVTQPEAVRTFFTFCFAGMPMIGYTAGAVIMAFCNMEKEMPGITNELRERHANQEGGTKHESDGAR